jgi:ABC-type dipeptide/oligopeptide/nickel transport system permease component
MSRYLVRRVLFMLPILYCVSTLVFFLIHLIPGNPVDLILGEQALMGDRVLLERQLGLHRPLWQQQFYYISNLLQGDWGVSLFQHRPVLYMIGERFVATLQLTLVAMGVALGIALPVGILAALKKHSLWDYGSMLGALFGISMPNFWLGPLLVIVFAIHLDWFPVSGREVPRSIILPALTLGTAMAAILSRMMRSAMLDVLGEDYLRTARAKGLREWSVIVKHGVRNALNPVVSVMGLQIGALLAGAIVTEKVFSWPGVGLLLIESIERRDYPVVQGCILIIALSYAMVNLLTDVTYQKLDPRVQLGGMG